ncbi:MAG: hypothetical protein ACRDTH_10545 [Pseudonocardiaceae bacterium]
MYRIVSDAAVSEQVVALPDEALVSYAETEHTGALVSARSTLAR